MVENIKIPDNVKAKEKPKLVLPENVKSRRGKPPTWYKEESLTNFERMISNPEGEKIREKEVEYQKIVDQNTTEIPIVKNIKKS